jgi:hypothetical protein
MAGERTIVPSMRKLLSSRRGMLASAAAAVAALHGLRPEVAHAAPIAGDTNSAYIPAVQGTHSGIGGVQAIRGDAIGATGSNVGVYGSVSSSSDEAAGVEGSAGGAGRNYGVLGTTGSETVNASGVKGVGRFGASNGVWGAHERDGIGVLGQTAGSGAGVRGEVTGASSSPGSGVVGVAASCTFGNASSVGVGGSGRDVDGVSGAKTGVLGITGSTGVGVEGWATRGGTGIRGSSNYGGGPDFSGSGIGVEGRSGSGYGVRGESSSGIGVVGQSSNNYGAQGVTLKAAYAGLVGVGAVPGSAGFYAVGVAGAAAGTFQGNVIINGSLTVTGSYPKSAAVKKRDGSQVRMYCQESPEPWFEDFGTATLANGRAVVDLDPEFDEVVKGDDYRVFLTPIGAECGSVYVARKGPHRFEVRSHAGTSANGTFDYRVVARRLDDVGRRMEKVELPKMAPIDIERLTGPVQEPSRPEAPARPR